MLFLFNLPILPMSGQAFYQSTILVLFALIYGLLTLTNVYWDEAPMLFVFGFETYSTCSTFWSILFHCGFGKPFQILYPNCCFIF